VGYLTVVSVSLGTQYQMVGWQMNWKGFASGGTLLEFAWRGWGKPWNPQESWCPDRDSNGPPPEYKSSRALPPGQPTQIAGQETKSTNHMECDTVLYHRGENPTSHKLTKCTQNVTVEVRWLPFDYLKIRMTYRKSVPTIKCVFYFSLQLSFEIFFVQINI
jgi:hypothetical protein